MIGVIALGNIVNDFFVGPVKKFPDFGQMFFVDKVISVLGGTCGIMASGLGKMGVEVKVLGKIGNDKYGDFVLERLVKNGVDISELERVQDVQTPITLGFANKEGEKRLMHCFGTDAIIEEKDIDLSKYNSNYIFYVGGIDILLKMRGKPIARVLEKAKEKSMMTVMDTVYDPLHKGFSVIKDSIPLVDILFTSLDEAKGYAGSEKPEEIFNFLLDNNAKTIVLKMGGKGCSLCHDKIIHEIPALDVEVIDTIGAGDNFVAGFLAGIINCIKSE